MSKVATVTYQGPAECHDMIDIAESGEQGRLDLCPLVVYSLMEKTATGVGCLQRRRKTGTLWRIRLR